MSTYMRRIALFAIAAAVMGLTTPMAGAFQQTPATASTPPATTSARPAAGTAAPGQQGAGLESPWDVRQILDNVVKANDRFKPLLGSMNPQEWVDKKGAASGYVTQWQAAQRQVADVDVVAKLFAQKTESLSTALDLYFRLEALETTARSLDDGAKRYADRQTADQMTVLIASDFDSRQRLREYVRNLSSDLEQNFKIADAEAQRCRGMISKEPAVPSSRKSKTR